MARKVTIATRLSDMAGQWILRHSPDINGGHLPPNKVVDATGDRVRYMTNSKGNAQKLTCLRRSVDLVCETKEEAERIYKHTETLHEAIRLAKALFTDRVNQNIF